jgi:hypothetical protein
MRKLLLIVVTLLSLSVCAQENPEKKVDENVIFKVVPERWNIRDCIKIRNKSPYRILQVVVALVVGDRLEPLGTTTNIFPDECETIASFRKNSLRFLRGQTIAIKAKALRIAIEDIKGADIGTPFGGISFRNRDIDKETLNSLGPECFTYEFDAKMFEDRHDLFIDLYAAAGDDIMNF